MSSASAHPQKVSISHYGDLKSPEQTWTLDRDNIPCAASLLTIQWKASLYIISAIQIILCWASDRKFYVVSSLISWSQGEEKMPGCSFLFIHATRIAFRKPTPYLMPLITLSPVAGSNPHHNQLPMKKIPPWTILCKCWRTLTKEN